jgi:hypothetical protein
MVYNNSKRPIRTDPALVMAYSVYLFVFIAHVYSLVLRALLHIIIIYIPLELYLRRDSIDIANILSRHPHFNKMTQLFIYLFIINTNKTYTNLFSIIHANIIG